MTTWIQSNLEAMSETDGHGDTCGPIVIADYLHVAQGLALNVQEIDKMRQDLINWGLFDAGMTLTGIATAFEQHYNTKVLKLVEWNPSLNFGAFRQDLITAMENHQAVIMETNNAQALPNNQQGVQIHFILAWGIDSNLGYWVANGDTYRELNSTSPGSPDWVNIGSLQAAQISAYLILPAVEPVATPIVLEEIAGVIVGAHNADNTTIHVGGGVAKEINGRNWLGNEILIGETYTDTDKDSSTAGLPATSTEVSYTVLSANKNPFAVFIFSQAHGVTVYENTSLAQLLVNITNENNRHKVTGDDTATNAAVTQLVQDQAKLDTEMDIFDKQLMQSDTDVANVQKSQSTDE